ncbi:MAG: glycosyltransferase family 4 protein [Candidatus Omnitrophota bacterium]
MNILIITTRLNLGGIGVYVVSLARGLKQKGHKVIVASSGGDLKEVLTSCGIEHIDVPIDTSSEVGPHVMIAGMKLLKVIKNEKIDIVHAQTRVSQVIAHYLHKFSKVTVVTTCHGFFKSRLIRMFLPCWGSRVIAISDAVKEHLVIAMKVPEKNIELIYNGIDTSFLGQKYSESEHKKIKEQFNLTSDFVIGITARLSSVKGHVYLLRAMSRIKNVFPKAQLLIVGSGSKKYERSLHDICNKLNIENSVIFYPAIQNIYKALSVMDVFVLPSIQEGLGLSMIEAMAVGIPVVASNVGGVSSVIEHEKNGILVAPKDDSVLAEAILRLLNDKEFARKLGEEGKKTVQDKFTLNRMVEKTERFYLNALR